MADVEKDILLKVSSDTNDATKGFKSLKQELREIEKEMNKMSEAGQEGSAQFQKMAQRAGQLKDQIGDTKARINALASDTYKLDAMTQAIQGIAGGFAVAQGAMAVFGSENEDLQKAILKTQGAMAILQGVTEITNILQKESAFSSLFLSNAQKANAVSTEVATTATKGFSRALVATGIGAIIVLIGTLVAYWDDLKEAVSGVSQETEAMIKKSKLDTEQAEKKYNLTKDTENVLKLQGKSQRDILNIKIKETDAIINGIKSQIKGQQLANKQAVEGAKRNKDIVMGILNVLTYPMKLLTNSIDGIVNGLIETANFFGAGIDFKLNLGESFEKVKDFGASILFDPEEMAKEGEKSVDEMEKKLNQMVNEQAGFKLEVQKLDKEASDKALKQREEDQKKIDEANKKAEEAKKKNSEDFLKRTEDELNKAKELSNGYFDTLITNAKVNNQSTADLELQKLEQLLQIQKDYGASTIDIENQIALKKKEIADKTKEEQKKALEKGAEDYSQTYDEINSILTNGLQNGILTQEQYNEAVKKLDQAQLQGKKELTKGVADLFGALSDAVGKETKAGKALASAQALINTYLGISEVIKAKNPYPEPFGTAVKIANASVIALNGFKQVREINKVQIPNSGGGGGGSVPSGAGLTSAPSASAFGSQLPTGTQIQLDQFGDLKQNRSVKAYVVESEMTDMQGRSKRLKATSKIK
jgi:hypothetical protein